MSNWYDITISREMMKSKGLTEDMVVAWLKQNCSKWAYGRETGDTGYEHLQCRIVTKLGYRETVDVWKHVGHVSYTHAKDFDYVLKDGNCVCSWRMALDKFREVELRQWQEEAKGKLSLQNDREILVIVDPVGGAGKSYLAKHLESLSMAKVIPKMSRADDMISAAMVNPSDGYIFDIPRADDKRASSLWIAIEQIKSGHLYDWRYQYREMWIEAPRIMVFSNYLPPAEMLSKDRWQVFVIENDQLNGKTL